MEYDIPEVYKIPKEYKINKKIVTLKAECGMYMSMDAGLRKVFYDMDTDGIVGKINSVPLTDAIAAITELKNAASEQARSKFTPQGTGYPELKQIPPPIDINVIRAYIINANDFLDDVLKALKGE